MGLSQIPYFFLKPLVVAPEISGLSIGDSYNNRLLLHYFLLLYNSHLIPSVIRIFI